VVAVIAAAFLLSARAAAAAEVTRFAVIAGNNIGLASAEPLKYAERDARRMAVLLSEIGGVKSGDLALLEGAGPDDLRPARKRRRAIRFSFSTTPATRTRAGSAWAGAVSPSPSSASGSS
jgi:hypothetical protein